MEFPTFGKFEIEKEEGEIFEERIFQQQHPSDYMGLGPLLLTGFVAIIFCLIPAICFLIMWFHDSYRMPCWASPSSNLGHPRRTFSNEDWEFNVTEIVKHWSFAGFMINFLAFISFVEVIAIQFLPCAFFQRHDIWKRGTKIGLLIGSILLLLSVVASGGMRF